MAKKLRNKIDGFTGGLNTERSPANILPSEMADGSINVLLNNDGSVTPRRGVDFIGSSSSTSLKTLYTTTIAAEQYHESPSVLFYEFMTERKLPVKKVVVFQSNTFKIYKAEKSYLVDYANPTQTINPSTHVYTDQKYTHASLAPAPGKILFTGHYLQPGFLKLNSDETTIDVSYFEVWWRDISNTTKKCDKVKKTVSGVISYYECMEDHTSAAGDEPGVGANWTRYWRKLTFTPPTSPSAWASGATYNSHIYKNFLTSVTLDSAIYHRPDCIHFWQGRIWILRGTRLWYSRIISDDNQITPGLLCFQDADPFDTDDNIAVASDGGFIDLEFTGVQLTSIPGSLFIGTTGGVIEIPAGRDGFDHTKSKVNTVIRDKIPGARCIAMADISVYVFAEGNIWTNDGYDDFGNARFTPVGDDKVQSMYTNIPRECKAAATAIYNPGDRRVYYFHSPEAPAFEVDKRTGEGVPGYAAGVLVFDTVQSTLSVDPLAQQEKKVKNRFMLWTFDHEPEDGKPYIAAPFISPSYELATLEVIDGSGNNVIDGSGNNVVVYSSDGAAEDRTRVMFLSMAYQESGSTLTVKGAVGQLQGIYLKDWTTEVAYEKSYSTVIITGAQDLGDFSATKRNIYLDVMYEIMAAGTSSINLKVAFDLAEFNTASTKLTNHGEIYSANRNVGGTNIALTVGQARTYRKLARGSGRFMQVIFEGTAGKDFIIYGWGQQFTGAEA